VSGTADETMSACVLYFSVLCGPDGAEARNLFLFQRFASAFMEEMCADRVYPVVV
jgi:hypothetical protein